MKVSLALPSPMLALAGRHAPGVPAAAASVAAAGAGKGVPETGMSGEAGRTGPGAGEGNDHGGNGGNGGNGGDGGKGGRRPRGIGRRIGRALVYAVLFVVLLAALLLGALFGAVHTERGTRLAWQAATRLLPAHLSGRLEGGALQTGVRLHDVAWRSAGLEVRVDRVSGRWHLSRAPWRFTLEYLRVGTVDVRIAPAPSRPGSPATLPDSLVSPIQLDIRDVRVEKIAVHSGASTTRIDALALHGGTDGRHHRLVLDGVSTPYGDAHARVALDGVRPFATTGTARFAGAVSGQAVDVSARVSGSLETLVADVAASGMKLAGQAHIEATPFASVPVKLVTIAADHLNPQAFGAGAPAADLKVRAQLRPVASPAAGTPLVVSGPISIENASPGSLDAKRLPLIDARATVRLDASAQTVEALRVRLLNDATVTGRGRLSQGRGELALDIAKLDLHALHAALRPTQLAGTVALGLKGDTQTVAARLADPAAALALRAAVVATPAQTAFRQVQLSVGKGRADLSGTLKRDTDASFAFKGTLRDFDPLALMSAQQASAPAPRQGASRQTAGRPATVRPTADRPAATRQTATRQTATRQTATRRIEARVSGTFDATGTLAPEVRAKIGFALNDSVYDGLPMTGSGTVQLAGTRLLPSRARLSVAGNDVALDGSFGAPADRLNFTIQAPQLDRLGFGLAGELSARGDVTGSIAHPNVTAQYQASGLVLGDLRLGHAQGQAQLRDGANGALNASVDARDLSAPGLSLQTLTARVSGTRARHTLDASAQGSLRGNRLDASLAAQGGLTDNHGVTGWRGTISQLQNRGTPALQLSAPVSIVAAPRHVEIGATRLSLEGAVLDLRNALYQEGQIRSAGTVTGIDVARMLALQAEFTGKPNTTLTDLVLDGDWDFGLGATASGHIALRRHGGDLQVNAGQGPAGLGIEKLSARVDFPGGSRAHLTVNAQAARLGTLAAALDSTLVERDGLLTLADASPLNGTIAADLPSLRTTGGLLGPTYIFDGAIGLRLAVAGNVGKPKLSGTISGQKLGATLVDQGVQLRNGVIDIAISDNIVQFRNVSFHGSTGTLSATGRVQLDADNPGITAHIVADKLELFGAPDRQLAISGQASVANAGPGGGLAIDGKFAVDHARFDLPKTSAPRLGDDVVIVRSNGQTDTAAPPKAVSGVEKPIGPFAPIANIAIDLGHDFHFEGAGAVLGLTGALTVRSAPNEALSAVGTVSVTPGSTYEAFGRKLGIETGYFTFNGPVDNPSINLLAMRRNQEVEAGVRVQGTLRSPDVTLVSEPSVTQNEKLSWLLFGHGTDTGQNLGQQNTMTAALALLGSAGGKTLARSVGLDEFSIGTSDSGLTDAQVISVAKALNEHFVLGYEQGLQSAGYLFKLTWLLSRRWSVAAQAGTYNGLSLMFTNRFD
ncbi:translocation/assembly module TamB domain-containing protein [Robbsia sp. Bb-Pol-6]|uniref:Translocation/assembly module TamB domain-containing protein n=1 Tax=Robbsia betulipollinis TaxID=2981849 RepID=A0ABT3ZLN5_9BURK|nr:translocation/assembly module TamB domain-containing protein [Robbsia betulipollinis]MCY0387449.1 translocation/assembly module TamB domain-containing protein [Robbsia betulipollinis]